MRSANAYRPISARVVASRTRFPRRAIHLAQTIKKHEQPRTIEVIAHLASIAARIGTENFYGELLDAFAKHLRADLSMVMRYSRRHAPVYVIHEGLEPGHMDLYLRGLYRIDPIYKVCRQSGAEGVRDLASVSTPADRSGDYFNLFLRLTGMADDLVMLLPVDAETYIGVVYERRTPFSPGETEELRTLFPLIESLHGVHQRIVGAPRPAKAGKKGSGNPPVSPGLQPIDHKAALGSFLEHELTPRERDIVHLMLIGYPNIKIAERLKLSINTVKNHKKRMYLKLDITTERELFLAFVNFLISGQVGTGPFGVHWH